MTIVHGPPRGGNDKPEDPPEVEVFRLLVASRRRGDRSVIGRHQAELRRLGWTVTATAPRERWGRP